MEFSRWLPMHMACSRENHDALATFNAKGYMAIMADRMIFLSLEAGQHKKLRIPLLSHTFIIP